MIRRTFLKTALTALGALLLPKHNPDRSQFARETRLIVNWFNIQWPPIEGTGDHYVSDDLSRVIYYSVRLGDNGAPEEIHTLMWEEEIDV